MRELEALPDEQLYKVLDYIQFLGSKYAPGRAADAAGFQRFAERVEDRMRARVLAPWAVGGALKLLSAAGRVLHGVADLGEALLRERAEPGPRPPHGERPTDGGAARPYRMPDEDDGTGGGPSARAIPID